MIRFVLAALALACALSSPALAQVVTGATTAAPAVPAVTVVPAVGIASLPYGEWLVAALQAIQPLAILVITFAFRTLISKLLPIGSAFITDKFVETTVQKWVDYGINATAGAMKDKKLDVETGSAVLATALNRAADRANVSKLGEKLMTWAGGPEEVANKIFRKLNLDEHASTAMVTEAVQDLRLRTVAEQPAAAGQAKF